MNCHKKTHLNIFIVIVVLINALFFTYPSNANNIPFKVTLQLNWKYQFEFAGFIVAKNMGFYKKEGLDVKINELQNQNSDIVNNVLTGKSDFGVVGSYLIYKAATNAKVKALIPILQHSPSALMVLKSSGITSLRQLNGKKIAIADRYVFVRAMLKANGIKYKACTPEYSISDLINGKIDAMTVYISNEPFIAREKGFQTKLFKPSDYGFDGYGDILFTSKRFLQQHTQIANKFIKATLKGWRYAFAHTTKTVNLIYDKYNTLHKTKKALLYEASVIRKLSGYDNGNFATFDISRIRNIAQIYQYIIPGKYKMNNLTGFVYKNNQLTKQEIYYLLKKRIIKICVFPNFYPLEAVKNGQYVGVTKIIIDKLKQKLPIPVKIIVTKNNNEAIQKTIQGVCDIKSLALENYTKYKNKLFIIPYIRDYFVVITKINKPYLKSINYFKNKLFVVNRKGFEIYLKSKYPYIKIKYENNINNILQQIKQNKIYGFIVPSVVANVIVKHFGYQEIKVNAKVYGSSLVFGLGVQKTEPQLFKIVKKIISGISNDNLNRLLTFYDLQSYKQTKTKYITSIAIALSALSFILLILFAFYKFKNNQLQQLLDSSISGVAIFKNNRLTMANKPALNIMGYKSVDEIKGKNIMDFIAQEHEEKLKKSLKKRIVKPYELYLIKKNGSKIPTLSMGTKINNTTRIVSFIDLSEIKKVQNKLEQLNATLDEKIKQEVEKSRQQQLILLQQARYSQMGEVISMIAHQWRQPLNILSVLLQKLQIRYQMENLDNETIEEVLDKSNVQIKQMSYIIDEFRNFFKPTQEMTNFNASKAIEEIISTLKPIFIDLNINVNLDCDKSIEISGFKNEFKQAVMNIINNAKDALKSKKGEKSITISVKYDKKDVKITVEDNGGGVEENIMDSIFEPYFSTKSKDGTGIGLYITKIIIEKHMNGIIKVENTQKGAKFIVRIPKVKKSGNVDTKI